jgi:hypothetical protein
MLADLGPWPGESQARRADRGLTGRFDDHHGALATILLAQIDSLRAEIDSPAALTVAVIEDMTWADEASIGPAEVGRRRLS